MFTIIGGVYRENCLDPAFFETLGSGGRAAIAVSQLVGGMRGGIDLYTSATKEDVHRLGPILSGLGVTLHVQHRLQTIEFQYNHSADKAVLFPDYRSIRQLDKLNVPTDLDAVLLFGLIELADLPTFKARRVVYDPQAGQYAQPFRSELRRAEELAIVCNYGEAIALTRAHGLNADKLSPLELGRAILVAEGAAVVIVKNGPFGAIVITSRSQRVIPSYKTGSVFGIGTGDIFSAVFAALWAGCNGEVFTAAELASIATGHVCSQPVGYARLPIVPKNVGALKRGLVAIDLRRVRRDGMVKPQKAINVYLAGPFFSLAQVWLVNELKRALEGMRLPVWSPMAEAGVLPVGAADNLVREVVAKDIAALNASSLVFAVLDGLDPGTLYEIGFAACRGIPVIALSQQPSPGDLTMLRGTPRCHIFTDVATALYNAAWIGHAL